MLTREAEQALDLMATTGAITASIVISKLGFS
jgi:hypothetical protein